MHNRLFPGNEQYAQETARTLYSYWSTGFNNEALTLRWLELNDVLRREAVNKLEMLREGHLRTDVNDMFTGRSLRLRSTYVMFEFFHGLALVTQQPVTVAANQDGNMYYRRFDGQTLSGDAPSAGPLQGDALILFQPARLDGQDASVDQRDSNHFDLVWEGKEMPDMIQDWAMASYKNPPTCCWCLKDGDDVSEC